MKSLLIFTIIGAITTGGIINQKNDNSLKDIPVNSIYHDMTEEEAESYYSGINVGDKGDTLLDKLQNILKQGQVKLKYESGNKTSKSWDGYYLYERNYDLSPLQEDELSGKYHKTDIWINSLYCTSPIYIDDSINKGTFKYLDADGNEHTSTFESSKGSFDREHVFPKSFGFNNPDDKEGYKSYTAGCDVQNLHIGEHFGNSVGHNNLPYGNVVEKNKDSEIRSSLTNDVIGYKGNNKDGIEVFEPLDHDKGNIARSIFYMAARYHNYEELDSIDKTPALTIKDNVSNDKGTISPEQTKDTPAAYGELSDLLEWNIIDPVDKYEVHRNNLAYNAVQFNRNPFVDYPSWVEACFDPNYIAQDGSGITFDNYQTVENAGIEDTNTYSLEIVAGEGLKNKYYWFEHFDPTGISINFNVNGEPVENVEFELYSGDQKMTSDYMFLGVGKMELKAKVKYNNRYITSSNTLEITLEISKTQAIILGVIGIIVLILIILLIVWLRKKKNRKKVKYLENKVNKVAKEVKKSKKKKKKN